MRPTALLTLLLAWISAWLPRTPDLTTFALAVLSLTLPSLAWRGAPRPKTARFLSILALLPLLACALFAAAAFLFGPTPHGTLVLFTIANLSAYAFFLARLLSPTPRLTTPITLLLALTVWSWGSALAMATHRGAAPTDAPTCILTATSPSTDSYTRALTSLWDMRLPAFHAETGGKLQFTYHALLIVEGPTPTVYNWSKLKLRFDPLDLTRNPYQPTTCPR
ncbi:hypothetical protein [Rhodovulum sp. FJ3]|uniref:hypothetical protein n=1 Tax=Rhodovulum sp. FJ3 TaxID=3079053 RepID=UPI00293DEE92|nr:hypothetical protein [Rhodovulum sp. FJ3]MDV4166599.1 hypothetical protein [Rhodovulum sp. FJ3]